MDSNTKRPRVIAFHLPQFHPIPENDAWWGRGFTEWTNVTRARPLFDGHFQPRLPADLGFYDLRLPEAREAQAQLAQEYGIDGFCFHYYWFKDGKRLLERPLEEMLTSGKPDFPFCLCWANENWTRRWDGQEKEVLMEQEHSAESDLAFLHSVLPYFRDPRYIRVKGRPLLVIYRVDLFPDFAATVGRWQQEMRRLGEPAPYLVAAETFGLTGEGLRSAPFDATCEFPPHGAGKTALPKKAQPAFNSPFSGLLLDYEKIVDLFLGRPAPELRRLRTVTLGWDNTARKKSAAHVAVNFSLEAYHRWLSGAIELAMQTDPEDERIVFINAWNEWAEGTYLEPDQLYGHAYLEATRAALRGEPLPRKGGTDSARVDAAPSQPDEEMPAPAAVESGGERSHADSPFRTDRKRLVGIAMVGNEADMVEAFVRENCRLLDHLVIADHNSIDGTREILAELVAEGLPVMVERIESPVYAQTEVCNRLLDAALRRFDPQWVFPLDVDEILDAADRADLEQELAGIPDRHGCLAWVTHVPTATDDATEPHPLRRLRHRYAYPVPSRSDNPYAWKLVLNAGLLAPYLDRYALEKGSHRLVFLGTNEPAGQPVEPLARARLRHYPVRSYRQLAIKVGIGMPQKLLNVSSLDTAGVHWPPMWKRMLEGRHDLELLQSACRQYLDPGRVTPDQTADVPTMHDAFAAPQALRYENRRVSNEAIFMRWISQSLELDKRHSEAASSDSGKAAAFQTVPQPGAEPVWKTHLDSEVEVSSAYHDNPRRELVALVDRPVTALLDIGCAGGATSLLVRERFPGCRTVGIEINSGVAALASERLDKVLCADVETMELPSGELPAASFDLVLLADVLEHLHNPWRLLEKLRRLLMRQGRIIACVPNVFNLGVMEKLVHGSWSYEKDGILDITHLRFFARDDAIRLFTETGYRVEQVHGLATPDGELPKYYREGLLGLRTRHLAFRGLPADRLENLLTKQFVVVATPAD